MYFFNRMTLKAGALAAVAAFVLAACTVVVEDRPGGPPPRPGGPPQACTFEYAPVCGQRGNDRQTFGNACLARVEGYRIIADGECRRGGPGRPPEICTREYAPVCGERRGQRQTFGNDCVANAEGFRVLYAGECRTGGGGWSGSGGPRPPQICTREYAPVCATRRGETRTFGNACEAGAAEFRIIRPGTC